MHPFTVGGNGTQNNNSELTLKTKKLCFDMYCANLINHLYTSAFVIIFSINGN